ncbi:hypothetical protein V5799_028049 [Amblyomma americanum]|uniref:Secreted protein n=1 Tax=Amblyomma americanum TaxID=6943 RepID=A0AAQ4DDZ6_AMBAM
MASLPHFLPILIFTFGLLKARTARFRSWRACSFQAALKYEDFISECRNRSLLVLQHVKSNTPTGWYCHRLAPLSIAANISIPVKKETEWTERGSLRRTTGRYWTFFESPTSAVTPCTYPCLLLSCNSQPRIVVRKEIDGTPCRPFLAQILQSPEMPRAVGKNTSEMKAVTAILQSNALPHAA